MGLLQSTLRAIGSRPAADALIRCAAAQLRSVALSISPAQACDDLGLDKLVLRAATTPTSLANSGLSSMTIGDLQVLAPESAAIQLMSLGLTVSMSGTNFLQLPVYLTSASDGGSWVAEGSPIRVRGLALAPGPIFELRKLAAICCFTRELSEHTGVEAVVRAVLGRAMSLAMDAAVFSSSAADSSTPGGILNGISDEGASGASGQAALIDDVSTLVGALATLGGGTSVVFVTDPASAMRMKLWAPPRFDSPILASSAITAGTLVAVEAGAFVAAFNPTPEIDVSSEASIHQEDTSPAQLVAANGTAAGPTRSLWQTDCLALKAVIRGTFGMRAGLIAKIDSVSW
jgi:hypothetical protein